MNPMITCRNTNGLGDDITEAFTRAEVAQELRAGDMEPAQHTLNPHPAPVQLLVRWLGQIPAKMLRHGSGPPNGARCDTGAS